ncbi:MAG: 30S ribosomal protein S16 [Planctomycetota bacterium]
MAVRIRMVRQGRKNEPLYRIVVSDKRSKQNGAYIENLGNYNPKADVSKKITIKEERLAHWLKHGAQLSDALSVILNHTDKMPKI